MSGDEDETSGLDDVFRRRLYSSSSPLETSCLRVGVLKAIFSCGVVEVDCFGGGGGLEGVTRRDMSVLSLHTEEMKDVSPCCGNPAEVEVDIASAGLGVVGPAILGLIPSRKP